MKRRKYSKKRLLAFVMTAVMGIGSVQGLSYGGNRAKAMCQTEDSTTILDTTITDSNMAEKYKIGTEKETGSFVLPQSPGVTSYRNILHSNNLKIWFTGKELLEMPQFSKWGSSTVINEEDIYSSFYTESGGSNGFCYSTAVSRNNQTEFVYNYNGITYEYSIVCISLSSQEMLSYGGRSVGTMYAAVNLHLKDKSQLDKVNGTIALPKEIKAVSLPKLEGGYQTSESAYYDIPCIEIGDYGFANCQNLKNVTIPQSYQRVCDYAFLNCQQLQSVSVVGEDGQAADGSSIHMMGNHVFANCRALKNYLLPEQWTEGIMDTEGKYEAKKSYTGTSLRNASMSASDTHLYYMGVGVYQDCISLKRVELKGKNPYVPRYTFEGCTGVTELVYPKEVNKVLFDEYAFSGIGLEELEFPCDVLFGSRAFANCSSLKRVELKGSILQEAMYDSKYGGKPEAIFEHSFASGSVFLCNPNGKEDRESQVSEITIPYRFFYHASGLENFEVGTEDQSDYQLALLVEAGAFAGVNIENLQFECGDLIAKTGAFSGMKYTHKLIFRNHGKVTLEGEVFADSYNSQGQDTQWNNSVTNGIGTIEFDNSSKEGGKGTVLLKSGTTYDVTATEEQSKTKANFYGLTRTQIYFTDNIETIAGEDEQYCMEDYTKEDIVHSAMGNVSRIYLVNPNVKFLGVDTDGASSVFGNCKTGNGTNVSIYGSSYIMENNQYNNFITAKIAKLKNVDYKEYYTEIRVAQKEDFISFKGFEPDKIVVCLVAVDGSEKEIPYRNNQDKSGGYGISAGSEKEIREIGNEDKKIMLTIDCLELIQQVEVSVRAKRMKEISAQAKAGTVFVESTQLKATDFELKKAVYDDGSMESAETLEEAEFTLSLESGNPVFGAPGEEIVYLTYKGVTTPVTVTVEKKRVVSITVTQTAVLYEGDTLNPSKFQVTAEYNNGYVNEHFTDYTFDPTVLEKDTTSVMFYTADGYEKEVPITLSQLKAVSISADYRGEELESGMDVEKEDIRVDIIYENGKIASLDMTQYELEYEPIREGENNLVKVYYVSDNSLFVYVVVRGKENLVEETMGPLVEVTSEPIEALPTELPVSVPTSFPAVTGTPVVVTNAPQEDTEPVESSMSPNVEMTPEATQTVDWNEVQTEVTAESTSTPKVEVIVTAPDQATQPQTTMTPVAEVQEETQVPISVQTQYTYAGKTILGVGEGVCLSLAGKTVSSTISENEQIVKVEGADRIRAVGIGSVLLLITDTTGEQYSFQVVVKQAPTKLVVKCKKVIRKGNNSTLKVRFKNNAYSNQLKYTSSNKKVLTVSKKGVLHAKKAGVALITVKAYNGKKVKIKIRVRK